MADLLQFEPLVCKRHLLYRDVGALRVQGTARVLDDSRTKKLPRHHDGGVVLVLELYRHVAECAISDLIDPVVQVERTDDPTLQRDIAHLRETGELAWAVLLVVAVT